MDQQMNMSIRVPIFDGEDHVFWNIRMKNYMISISLEVWELVEEGYKFSEVTPIEAEERKKLWEHEKALNTLQDGISKKFLVGVLTYKIAKEIRDKLETIYVGESKLNMAKLQSLKVQYESLKMKDEENISEYL